MKKNAIDSIIDQQEKIRKMSNPLGLPEWILNPSDLSLNAQISDSMGIAKDFFGEPKKDEFGIRERWETAPLTDRLEWLKTERQHSNYTFGWEEIIENLEKETADLLLIEQIVNEAFELSDESEAKRHLINSKTDAQLLEKLQIMRKTEFATEIDKRIKTIGERFAQEEKEVKKNAFLASKKLMLLKQLGFFELEEYLNLPEMKKYEVMGALTDRHPYRIKDNLKGFANKKDSKSPYKHEKEIKDFLKLST